MQSPLSESLVNLFQKGLPILLSCLDDALLLSLSKIGISLPWLQGLSYFLLAATIAYWTFRLIRFLHRRYQISPIRGQL